MSENVSNVTDETFESEVLQSDLPVLIDFWAPWCGPCVSVAPVVEAIAVEFAGKLKVVKVNVEENQTSPANYQVRSIPNFVILKGGQLQQQIVGAAAKQDIVSAIETVLSSNA